MTDPHPAPSLDPIRVAALAARYAVESLIADQVESVVAQRDHHQRREVSLEDTIRLLNEVLGQVQNAARSAPPDGMSTARAEGWQQAQAVVLAILEGPDHSRMAPSPAPSEVATAL